MGLSRAIIFLRRRKQDKVHDNPLLTGQTQPASLTSLGRTCVKLNTKIYLLGLKEEPEPPSCGNCHPALENRAVTSPKQKLGPETSLVVEWLRLQAPDSGVLGSIPGQRTRTHMGQLRVHMLQLKIRRVMQQQRLKIPCATTKPQGSQVK